MNFSWCSQGFVNLVYGLVSDWPHLYPLIPNSVNLLMLIPLHCMPWIRVNGQGYKGAGREPSDSSGESLLPLSEHITACLSIPWAQIPGTQNKPLSFHLSGLPSTRKEQKWIGVKVIRLILRNKKMKALLNLTQGRFQPQGLEAVRER